MFKDDKILSLNIYFDTIFITEKNFIYLYVIYKYENMPKKINVFFIDVCASRDLKLFYIIKKYLKDSIRAKIKILISNVVKKL